MKPKEILPSGRICMSEWLVVAGLFCLHVGFALVFVAMFLEMPWVVAIGIAVVVRLGVRRRQSRSNLGIHGNADWASGEQAATANLIGGTGAILGKLSNPPRQREDLFLTLKIISMRFRKVARLRYLLDQLFISAFPIKRRPVPPLVRVPDADHIAHVSCYLPTGVGKTFKIVTPSLLQCPENAVVYDPSGETVRATAQHRRREFGHEIRVIDPFGVSGVPESDRLNVLDLIGSDNPGCFDFCSHIGHALVVEKPESQKEPFWHGATVFSTVFLLLAIIRNGNQRYRNLLSVGGLLNGERLLDLARGLADHPDATLRRRAEQMLNYKGKTLDSLLACLTTEHAWLDSPAFSSALCDSTFQLRSLFERPMTLYIVIPGHRALESQPFVRAMLTAILFTAFELGPDRHRPPVRFYLDEVATLGKLDLLMTLYTQGRKYGLRSINFFQSVGQVAEIVGTPDKIQTFRSQMAVELFKAKDYETAKGVSEWIGNKTVQTESTARQFGTNCGWSYSAGANYSQGRSGGSSESRTTTVSETGVPVIRPEQVLQLQQNEAILLAAGTPPVKVTILDAADVARCANGKTTRRKQKGYLWRVRFFALFYCVFGPVAMFVGGLATLEGMGVSWRHHLVALPWFEPVKKPAKEPPALQAGRTSRPPHVRRHR